MSELKTLKDLDSGEHGEKVLISELRHEVIKWIGEMHEKGGMKQAIWFAEMFFNLTAEEIWEMG